MNVLKGHPIAPAPALHALPYGRAVAMLVAAVCGLSAFLAVDSAHAQSRGIFKCTDATGRTITSDRPIPECSNRPVAELNRDGSLRRTHMPPLTPEEQVAKREADLKQREAENEAKLQQKRDRNLLEMFKDPEALEAQRKRFNTDIDSDIQQANDRILLLGKEMDLAKQATEEWKQKNPAAGSNIPFNLRQRLHDTTNAVLSEQARIAEREAERTRTNAKYDSDADRLRLLQGGGTNSAETPAASAEAGSAKARPRHVRNAP